MAGRARQLAHRRVENFGLSRPFAAPFPQILAVQLAEGRLAGPHALQHLAPGLPDIGAADVTRPGRARVRRIRSQAIADRRKPEMLVGQFFEDARGGQHVQQAVERTRVASRGRRDLVAGQAAVLQDVGDTERGRDRDRLRNLKTADQLHELDCRGLRAHSCDPLACPNRRGCWPPWPPCPSASPPPRSGHETPATTSRRPPRLRPRESASSPRCRAPC